LRSVSKLGSAAAVTVEGLQTAAAIMSAEQALQQAPARA
jgi:hypothetical protein